MAEGVTCPCGACKYHVVIDDPRSGYWSVESTSGCRSVAFWPQGPHTAIPDHAFCPRCGARLIFNEAGGPVFEPRRSHDEMWRIVEEMKADRAAAMAQTDRVVESRQSDIDAAVAEERERCAKAACMMCRDDVTRTFDWAVMRWQHEYADLAQGHIDHEWCRASAILGPPAQPQEADHE